MAHTGTRRRQRTTLFEEVRQQLLVELTDGTYGIGERLASEVELARNYAVSRATLREILSSLERDGLVRRVHGVGTFVTAPERRVRSALNVDVGVTEAVSASNVPSEVTLLRKDVEPIPGWMATRLGHEADALGLHVERLILIAGEPAVHVVDVIPSSVIGDAGAPDYEGGSVYAFLESACNLRLHGGSVDIVPVLPTAALGRHLNCPRGAPLLRLEQIEYDPSGRAVLFSQEHYLPSAVTVTVHRERARSLGTLKCID